MVTKTQVLESLKKNVECTTTYQDGTIWGDVYLPNIGSSHQIAGYLSALKQEGLYKPVAKMFGEVRIG